MATTIVFRGSTVHFETTFYDRNNLVTNPVGATLYVSHRSGTTFVTDSPITMTGPVGNLWSADWESLGIEAGDVDWCIRTTASPRIVDQGSFTLQANQANPSS